MPISSFSIIAAVIALALAFLLHHIYNRLPESWLQDYDFDPAAPSVRLARRMKLFPHTVCIMVCISVAVFLGMQMNPDYVAKRYVFHILLMILPLYPLALIVISDQLNKIIPDQLVVVAAIISVFGFLADYLEGNLWLASTPWYSLFLNRLLGGVVGAIVLLAIGFIGTNISGQESMGFGDIKLIVACGLLCGLRGLPFVFFISFLVGGIFAFPLLIRKRRTLAAEQKLIQESANPVRTRKEIEKKKSEIHYADDPNVIAFGPFLGLGTAIFLVFESALHAYYLSDILPGLQVIFS